MTIRPSEIIPPFVPAGKSAEIRRPLPLLSPTPFLPQLRYIEDSNIIYKTKVAVAATTLMATAIAAAFDFGHGLVDR